MSRDLLNIALLVALIISFFVNWMIGRDSSRPNYEIMPDMVYSVPYDSFSENPNFANGKTLQEPIPGTIARGQQPLYYQATPEDALLAGEELQNPYPSDDTEALNEGAQVYRIHCIACHGATGRGDGPVAMRGYPPPPPFEGEKAMAMKDGQIFHLITYGQGNMPSYAAQVPVDDRWKAVMHVRALQQKAIAAIAAAAKEAEQAAAQIQTDQAELEDTASAGVPAASAVSELQTVPGAAQQPIPGPATSEQAPQQENVPPATAENPEQPTGEHP